MAKESRRDPITFELMQHAIAAIADQMAVTVVRTARSTVAKEVMDFSTALCNADGELVALGLCLPLMLGSIPPAVQAVLKRFRNDCHPGDVYVLNDPYDGGAHLPDIYMFKPVFIGDNVLGFSCTVMHHADIGGIAAGGISSAATEIYQEGLCIPPLKLFDRGKPNETLLSIIRRNVRVPETVMADISSQVAACAEGEEGLIALVQEYGLETTQWYLRDLLDYSEERTRDAIRKLPDGEFSFCDHLDDDGLTTDPIPIRVSLKKLGDELTADFTGTAPQVKGAMNMTRSYALSSFYFAVRCILDPDIPNNEGFFRPLKVVTVPGTLVDALPPAPVASRVLTAIRASDTLLGALAQMLPERILACGVATDCNISVSGYYPDRGPFVQLDWLPGSWGGRPDKDGIDHLAGLCSNFSNTPVEVIEIESPLLVEEYSLVPDSAGVGKFRGGLSVTRKWRLRGAEEAKVHMRADRLKFLPYSLQGGKPGRPGQTLLSANGAIRQMPSKFQITIKRGDWIQHQTAGAGGWGDVLGRDPERVLKDVRDGKISAEHATGEYGVALSPDGRSIDRERTEALRAALRKRDSGA
ncbi:MAG: hydantoinase B/oxoprolinase family protein [Deltaproteobacteria bacterium]|nr:hydantoinase B/oxoprolinase family protein [Deltaproteobacteria bacterium]